MASPPLLSAQIQLDRSIFEALAQEVRRPKRLTRTAIVDRTAPSMFDGTIEDGSIVSIYEVAGALDITP